MVYFRSSKNLKLIGILGCALTTLLPLNTAMGFGIEAKGLLKTYGQPIHESITRKAVLDSGLFSKSDLLNLDSTADIEVEQLQSKALQHIVEGVRFNDDPEGYLLPGSENYNSISPVLRFGSEFLGIAKSKAESDPTKASHFGAYQYLHAMGVAGAKSNEIRDKIEHFIFHCWRMATDDHSYEKFKQDYEIVSNQIKIEADPDAPASMFRYTPEQRIVRQSIALFPKGVIFFHATNQLQFQYRALGALLHVIQDSYAKGHVVRTGWENGDNSGNIRYFQSYGEQSSEAHQDFDTVPGGVAGNNFLKIPGAKMALERSKQLLVLVKNHCPWARNEIEAGSACNQSIYGFIRDVVFAFENTSSEENSVTHAHPELLPKPKVEIEP